jgi:hypothetical protein
MVLRWLIRGVCLLLLTGVVGIAAGSYAGWLMMGKGSAGRDWVFGAVQGLGYMYRSPDRGYSTTRLQFRFLRGETAKSVGLQPRTLGFYGRGRPRDAAGCKIGFPLWLPALLLVVLNGFVWRWTRRRKVGVGAVGFPVEPAKKADT